MSARRDDPAPETAPQRPRSFDWRDGDLRGVVAIAATYVYFLLFAQYGLLALLASRLPSASRRPVMAAMGVAGLAASVGAAWALRRAEREGADVGRALLLGAFAGGIAAALAALGARTLPAFVLVAAAVGLAVGALTVSLSAELLRWVRPPARGVKVAIGTGVAYLIVNVPALFAGPPERQAMTAAVAAAVGLLAVAVPARRSADQPRASCPRLAPDDARARGLAAVVLAFVALIALDSAAFAIIQGSVALKGPTWGSGAQSLRMGVLHLAGALAAGLLLDRRRFFSILVSAYVLFAAGLGLLDSGAGWSAGSGALYAIGIGAYSVALVLYPSAGGVGPGLVPRAWRAAAVYGIGGWLGSAAGVALAEGQQRIPAAMVAGAGALIVIAALLWPRRIATAVAASFGGAILCATIGFWIVGAAAASPPSASAARNSARDGAEAADTVAAVDAGRLAIERGRAVYIAEGCQHCHSQYVRLGGDDRARWGPWRRDAGSGDPPLYGVRRQGPDLANVGNRRSAVWQRLHLIDPRSLSPGSRMPSYALLFAARERRGDDLIAYLLSLGGSTGAERFRDIQGQPIEVDPAASTRHGQQLFGLYCARCHGATGRGDGALAPMLDHRAGLDLAAPRFFPTVSFGPGIGTFDQGLARLVRFGVPGTSMPGHEQLDAEEVSALVAYLHLLHGRDAGAAG